MAPFYTKGMRSKSIPFISTLPATIIEVPLYLFS